ncbi:MAG: carboxypeptidase-like regulatory domain-containing protein, partial [Muribaculaceae bacterium]|nr:carboxypeptidase-like regulatory domain-containing protein [Muribaculaceae bacterium]
MNGEPVNAAAVLLTPGGGTYLTGSDGIFTFYDIPSGSYEIKVYKEGCQPFNKSLTINKSQQNIALTVTENTGNLHLNKGYIDMGSNDGNNVGAFTITNNGQNELTWQATWGARWITKME